MGHRHLEIDYARRNGRIAQQTEVGKPSFQLESPYTRKLRRKVFSSGYEIPQGRQQLCELLCPCSEDVYSVE